MLKIGDRVKVGKRAGVIKTFYDFGQDAPFKFGVLFDGARKEEVVDHNKVEAEEAPAQPEEAGNATVADSTVDSTGEAGGDASSPGDDR